MQVEARFTGLPDGTAEIRMSRTSPGRYALHEFAKNVFEVTITDGDGKALAPTRPSLHQWNVTGHDGTVVVTYKVFGDRTDGTYLSVDAAHAHMNMPATVMFVRGQVRSPGAGHARAAAGPRLEGGDAAVPDRRPAGVHRAEHPLPDGQPHRVQQLHAPLVHHRRWRERSADVSNRARITTAPTRKPTCWRVTSRRSCARRARSSASCRSSTAASTPSWPTICRGSDGDGMEHRNSTVVSRRGALRNPDQRQNIIGTVSHEFFHSWNMERLRRQGDRTVRLRRGRRVRRAVVRRGLHQLLRRPDSRARRADAGRRRCSPTSPA